MNLTQTIVENLQRPRPVTFQLLQILTGRWEVTSEREDIESFFEKQYPTLDEFEQEDLLAPLYTPDFEQKRSVTPFLSAQRDSAEGWLKRLPKEVIASSPKATLEIEGVHPLSVAMPESVVERYVMLLEINRHPGEELAKRIESRYEEEACAQILTLLRERVWRSEAARDVLDRWLEAGSDDTPTDEEIGFLTDWMRGHPLVSGDPAALARNLTEWSQAHQQNRSPYHTEMIGALADPAQRRTAGKLIQTKHVVLPEERLELASRLADRLGAL